MPQSIRNISRPKTIPLKKYEIVDKKDNSEISSFAKVSDKEISVMEAFLSNTLKNILEKKLN